LPAGSDPNSRWPTWPSGSWSASSGRSEWPGLLMRCCSPGGSAAPTGFPCGYADGGRPPRSEAVAVGIPRGC
jgi:hypothetical protein